MPFHVSEETLPQGSLLRLRGRPTRNGNDPFRGYLERLVHVNRNRIIIDLAEVDYVDSAFLATLLAFSRRTRRRGGALKLIRLNQKLKDIFFVTQLFSLLEVFETLDQAQMSFSEAPAEETPVKRTA